MIFYIVEGNSVRAQLLMNKGVRLEKFGIFSFNHIGDPVFILGPDFSSQYNGIYFSLRKFIVFIISYLYI